MRTIDNMLEQADFASLFNHRRMLFHIGYNESSHEPDDGCYDLIASVGSYQLSCDSDGQGAGQALEEAGAPAPCYGDTGPLSGRHHVRMLMPNLLLKEYEESVFADSNRPRFSSK